MESFPTGFFTLKGMQDLNQIPLSDYPTRALVSLSNHDLPTFAGFWQGLDIEERIHDRPHQTGRRTYHPFGTCSDRRLKLSNAWLMTIASRPRSLIGLGHLKPLPMNCIPLF